ncbi:hypothetical protein [Microbispora sp. H10836]|uniref:hypothetical protein n=1 Tax=Microbispora sp. H10836 TaxID=2729106 RepID=UPI0014730C98|nr:hypothetical protein [Microbispora sp. H10836]
MKRLVASMAIVVLSVLGVVAPAHAVTDPVAILKKHLVPDHGVRISIAWKMDQGGAAIKFRHAGDLGFDASGVVTFDLAGQAKVENKAKDIFVGTNEGPTRSIAIGNETYSTGAYDHLLPDGKAWARIVSPKGTVAARRYSLLNVLDPATLKAVLATAKTKAPGMELDGVKTTLYTGVITVRQASPGTKMSAREGAQRIGWRLWIGSDGLIRRQMTTTTKRIQIGRRAAKELLSEDIHYSAWGSDVIITAPPAEEVWDVKSPF